MHGVQPVLVVAELRGGCWSILQVGTAAFAARRGGPAAPTAAAAAAAAAVDDAGSWR